MRTLPKFDYFRPASLAEAADLLDSYPERASILAGGTDLLVSMKLRTKRPAVIVDIKGISSLDYLTWDAETGLRIGPSFTVQSVVENRDVREYLPFLVGAALAIGHPQIRNRATVVGNLCNASPAADMAPSLLALGARLKVVGRGQEKFVPLEEFFTGPFKNRLDPGEMVAEIQVPAFPSRSAGYYAWLPKIVAVDETLVGAAAVVSLQDGRVLREARLALNSVAPTPIRAWKAEEFLRGQRVEDGLLREAAEIAAGETSPHTRADYRREITRLLVEQALREALNRVN